jgi:hypothetical protein
MGKIKEIDEIAERIAEITLQLIEDSVDWQIADQDLDGDEYSELHDMVMFLAIEKMYMSTKRKYYEHN